jgi:cytochrome c-type biogenesis protein CcmH/NrfG
LNLRPRFPAALALRAAARAGLKDFTGAVADYAAARDLAPDDPVLLNSLAWARATCPDDRVRDGAAAVADAARACEITDHRTFDYLDTLAAAYAEAGRFADAVSVQERVLEQVPGDRKAEYEARLALYRGGAPYREESGV